MEFSEFLNSGYVVLDGATGTNLQEAGMESGDCPEQWIVEHPDIFVGLQKQYIEAGSDVLYTPTFTSTSIKLAEYGLEGQQEALIQKLVSLTRRAIKESGSKRKIYMLGDISMTGQQLEPVGTLAFEELVNVYKQEVSFLLKEGVDGFAIETMMSLQECRAALLAVKEMCSLPVLVTLTYQEDGRTLFGTNPETAAVVMQAMGADAVGINCSTGPDSMIPAVRKMAEYLRIPIVVKPNAGLPQFLDGRTVYDMEPDVFVEHMMTLADAGASVLGGCCGTTPEHIRCLRAALNDREFTRRTVQTVRALTTERNVLPISLSGNFIIVGERINPTGKKALQEELREGKLDLVLDMAEEQTEHGAKVLDVNMGMNGIDEAERMVKTVQALTMAVDVPLCIDSSYVEVIEKALRIYPGRALINSISMEKGKMERLLPLAKKYGAMFILLPLSEKGLPKDMEEKKRIIHAVMEEAEKYGLAKEDIIVDGLVATIGANKQAALEVLETIRYCKEELQTATICGLSNISFGLPERVFVNSAFLTLAIGQGLTMAIANPNQASLANAALATDLLLCRKEADLRYIEGVQAVTVTKQEMPGREKEGTSWHPLFEAVAKGKDSHIVELVERELQAGEKPAGIIDTHLIPAINYVGELFEQKKYFLPQLIASAETMEKAIAHLEPLLKKERGGQVLDTVVMATVKGDIHDIGKNLVVLMLKNYGYRVIDLGKDVEAQDIIDCAIKEDASIIGLSALMTTTMMEMKHVLKLAKEQGVRARIIVGGAVVTESFAKEIGADGYSKDAREAVKLVNSLLGKEKERK